MSDLHNAKKYAVRRRRHSIWRNIVTCIAAVVVFCTTYALILPAITMEYSCGKEEHIHAEGCYKLTCGLEQTPGHFHDETCYDEKGKLICGKEEPQSHAHTRECYAPADPTAPTDPICGQAETPGHTHDLVTCYVLPKTLTCGQEEAAAHAHDPAACYTQQTDLTCGQQEHAGHAHSDACYTQQTSIICGQEESVEHAHTDACRSVTSVLACGQEESAGHTHADACYTTSSVLTCTLAETGGHTHTDACYTVGEIPELVCTQEEAPGHTHTDACYPAASQPQLICGKEEVEVHKHTDECYTLICILEEHTHTNECQIKEEPTETTAPTDASEPTETTAPTDASDPAETTAPTDASDPAESTAPTDASDPAETTAPTDASDPTETTAPTDAILEETNILAADGATPRAARGPFFNYIHNPNAGTTIYDSVNQIYSTKIDFDFSVTGAQLKQTNGEFFILVSDKVSVPAYGEHFKIKNRDNEETGEFWFELDTQTGRAKMIINFDKDKVANLKPDQEISGNMFFEGKVDKSAMQDDGHLEFELTEGVPIKVSNDKINNDNVEINKYDLSVAKAAGAPVATPGEGDAPGKATVHYDVEVTTTKGTPGVIDLNDSLGWTSGNPAACELKNMTVKKVSTTGETTQEVTPTIADKNWSMQLPKLEAGEKYVVSYDYEYTFANGDTTMVKSVSNTVHATSKVPGGRPEEKVDGEDTETVEKIIPPSPDPSLDKSGTEDKANQKIDWKVTFNEDRKTFGGNGDIELTDTMLDQANEGSLHVTADGNPLTLDTHYKVENGKLILLNPAQSTDIIEITYSTPSSALNQWTSGTALNKVENKVSYQGKFNPVETTATLEKEGGGVSKGVGTPVKGDGKLTIPWKVTITPGSNGIPAGTPFSDDVDIGDFNQKIDTGSVKIYYADASGNPITDASGNPIEVGGLSQLQYRDDDYNGGKHNLNFKFDQNPFGENVAPAGAEKVVVSYNTTANMPTYDTAFKNDTNVDEKKDHEELPYSPTWVYPEKNGTLSQEGDHLKIDWTVKYATNEKAVTEITDTLKAGGFGEHHYANSLGELTVWLSTGAEVKLKKDTDYTVTYYDADGNTVTDLGAGTAVSMKISFKADGGYVFPDYDKNKGSTIQFSYTTKTNDIPDVYTEYHNSAIAFGKEVTKDVPWDPGDLEKTHSEHVVDSEKGTVTIPWTVKVTSKSGKITTPITDSLKKADGTMTHYFPADPKLKITVLDQNGNSLGDLAMGTQYTVEYFGDYTGKAEDGNGVPAAEGKGNTYMVIKLLPEGEFVLPNGAKTLQLTYETVASPVPEGVETFDNTVWAIGKEAEDEDKIEPSKPTPTDKTVGRVEQTGVGVRIPWTATIKRGVVPLATLEEGTWYDQYNKGDYARHYFDLSTISFEYLDASGNVLAVGQEAEGEPSALPTYDVTCYNDCWNNNGLLATDDSKLCKPGDPARFIRLNFHEGDAFKHAPEGTESLRMHYYTYNNDVTAEESVKFKNNVQVSGQYKDASTSITKVEKTAMGSNWNWTKDTVNVGETDGTLKQWRIRATTSGARTFLTFTDILPEYVKLENVEVKHGGDQWNVTTSIGSFDAATGKFTGTDSNNNTVDGSCVKNEDGRYVLTLTVKAKEGTSFPSGHIFDVILTPKVDVASLPASLQGKQFSLTNQATVTHDEGGAPSNPSTQIWTDNRPDVADGSLAKGKFPLDGGGRLNYVVTINSEGKDLEPDGNSFVLIDTLTYKGTEFTVDETHQTYPKNALKGYEMRLDTSDAHMLRLYKADAEGRLEANDQGEIVHGTLLDASEWAMTVDTKTRADGTTEKIIRVTVPDGMPLLMLYSYNVELRTNPVDADVSQLHFTYSAKNTVRMYGHKKVEATDEKTQETWESSTGGGTTKTDYNTYTLKKVDAANNALLLSGAEFKVQAYTGGAWTDVQRDAADPEKKFVTDDRGVLTIQSDEAWMQDNVLYRAYEIKAPDGYVLPDSPMSFYFYRSNTADGQTPLDSTLTRGATDLAAGSNLLWVENTSAKAGIRLEKIWKDSQGNTIAGTANQDFELIQYRSDIKPEMSEGDNPMLSTRKLKITVAGNGWQDGQDVQYDTMKGTMMRLTVTNQWPDGNWAQIKDGYAVFTPVIPQIRRELIYQEGTSNVKAVTFTFPVTTVEESTIKFNTSRSNLTVTLEPLGRSAAAPVAVAGEGDTLEKVQSWPITLSPGNGYKWSSDGFDIDPDQAGVQPLPFAQKDADGKTWYYTYVVKEVNASAAYTVSYSNMNSDGELVSMSSGTIRVTNTRLENPPISLPNTGGIGTTVFTLAGLALTGGAGLGLCKTKAKRKRGMFEKE